MRSLNSKGVRLEAAREAFECDAAGVIGKLANVIPHMLADAIDERLRVGGTGAGRGAEPEEKPAVRQPEFKNRPPHSFWSPCV